MGGVEHCSCTVVVLNPTDKEETVKWASSATTVSDRPSPSEMMSVLTRIVPCYYTYSRRVFEAHASK